MSLANQNTAPDPKAGFEIGWDFAAHGVLPPAHLMQQECFAQGFNEAGQRKVKAVSPDRYIRKWLQVRANAWLRNKSVDATFTPDLIRKIDTRHCPVTRGELTHGTMTDTDWSIDRVNSDAAYTDGNLVVMSVKANAAKGDRTYFDLLALLASIGPGDCCDGLSRAEWMRVTLISSLIITYMEGDKVVFSYGCAPCVIPPPAGLPINPCCVLQMMISGRAAESRKMTAAYKAAMEVVPKPVRREFNALVRDIKKKCGGRDMLEAWASNSLFCRFNDAVKQLPQATLERVMNATSGPMKMRAEELNAESWKVESSGRVFG